jgi:DNA-directed RNA polymerase beta' subunit
MYLRELQTQERRSELSDGIECGDVIGRWLQTGDMVIVNRQPTLHRMGIMAHRVVAVPNLMRSQYNNEAITRTIGLPPNVTTPYNAVNPCIVLI